MSKDTPEVGDVWKDADEQVLIYIIRGDKNKNCEILVSDSKDVWDVQGWQLNEYYTYLGKSKANINDLFKTEQEK